jgi:hypothetical protein
MSADQNAIPDYAERIDLMAVFRTVKQPSKFAAGVDALVSKIECPSCHSIHDNPGALVTINCTCGLHMQSSATGFAIWRKPKLAVVS